MIVGIVVAVNTSEGAKTSSIAVYFTISSHHTSTPHSIILHAANRINKTLLNNWISYRIVVISNMSSLPSGPYLT